MTSPAENVAKTVNYLLISRVHESVEETLTLDPTIFVPVFLRPPLFLGETEDTQSNLRLESVFKKVAADIAFPERVGNAARSTGTSHAKIYIGSPHGNICVRMVSGSLYTVSDASQNYSLQNRPPNACAFVLHVQAVHGNVHLRLPRNFHGPITVNSHNPVRFSKALVANLRARQDPNDGKCKQYFLGDQSQSWHARHDWIIGDELRVEQVHGNVKIKYFEE